MRKTATFCKFDICYLKYSIKLGGETMSFFVASEQFYKKNAKRDCTECKGKGVVEFHVDQDDMNRAPCIKCFPDDAGAKRAEVWWKGITSAPRPQYIHYNGSW